MSLSPLVDEVVHVANNKDIAETGGGHTQKGVDFQRYWAIQRMVELEQSKSPDFLLLFEAIQDIAELDSVAAPTSITVYQVKKKDRKEWAWREITGLPTPPKAHPVTKEKVTASPIGKSITHTHVLATWSTSSLTQAWGYFRCRRGRTILFAWTASFVRLYATFRQHGGSRTKAVVE